MKLKTKRAIKALQERCNTVKLNGDMLERALGKESYEETKRFSEEIEIVLQELENTKRHIAGLNKKVCQQRGQLKVYQNKAKARKQNKKIMIDTRLSKLPECCADCPFVGLSLSRTAREVTCKITGEILEKNDFRSYRKSKNQ